jgi:putative flippase GtrA
MFIFIGGCSFLVNNLVYILYIHTIDKSLYRIRSEYVGVAIGFVLSAVLNYEANKRYTFESATTKRGALAERLRFFRTALMGVMLNLLLPRLYALFFSASCVLIFSYTMHSKFTFKKHKEIGIE